HQADREELVEFGQRPQHRNARIEMRAGTELDILLPVLEPRRNGDESGNSEIAGDIDDPKLAAGRFELAAQVAGVGILETIEIHGLALQTVVPPDPVGIALHQFEETLNDRFGKRVAGRATVRIRVDLPGPAVEEITKTGGKIAETAVTQRPGRRPFDFGGRIEPGGHLM